MSTIDEELAALDKRRDELILTRDQHFDTVILEVHEAVEGLPLDVARVLARDLHDKYRKRRPKKGGPE